MNVATRLRDMGHDVVTVDDIGLKGAHDEEHLFFAYGQGRIFVSHDGDFYLIHRSLQRWSVTPMHSGILITPDTLGVMQEARALDIFASSELPTASTLYSWDERLILFHDRDGVMLCVGAILELPSRGGRALRGRRGRSGEGDSSIAPTKSSLRPL